MKNNLMNVIYSIGLLLLVSAGVVGIIVGVLFVFPNVNLFGFKSVNERDTQIVYRDDVLTSAFASGNLIIESSSAQIEVKMSNVGYEGEGTIVVNESSTGVAFNSLNRTLVEWTQTIYNGVSYYRIKVLEPYGFVFNKKPTTVYINLPHRTSTDDFVHNFVLQNGYSKVNFSMVDEAENNVSDFMKINNLIVESASSVNVNSATNISLTNLKITSSNTSFNCQTDVSGNVQVEGNNGKQNFNSNITGTVSITGENNNFRGIQSGTVTFNASNGSLTMDSITGLTVTTKNANVSINQVSGAVDMTTQSGNLKIGKITAGGLNFTAGTPGSPTATALVEVNSELTGDVRVRNHGVGSISLKEVNGDVDIQSYQPDAGRIDVAFKDDASGCTAEIIGYDGDISVRGINGWVDIEVSGRFSRAGKANINAQFNSINLSGSTASYIWSGAYVIGHDEWGNVNIELAPGINNYGLYIFGARSATKDGESLTINSSDTEAGSQVTALSAGTGANKLEVHCQNKVVIK